MIKSLPLARISRRDLHLRGRTVVEHFIAPPNFGRLLALFQVLVKPKKVLPRTNTPEACTIKHYGSVIYGKWPDFVVSYWLFSCQLQKQACTNTPAYYGIRQLRIRNVFIAQAPPYFASSSVVQRKNVLHHLPPGANVIKLCSFITEDEAQ